VHWGVESLHVGIGPGIAASKQGGTDLAGDLAGRPETDISSRSVSVMARVPTAPATGPRTKGVNVGEAIYVLLIA
jgi:hypothetical protein